MRLNGRFCRHEGPINHQNYLEFSGCNSLISPQIAFKIGTLPDETLLDVAARVLLKFHLHRMSRTSGDGRVARPIRDIAVSKSGLVVEPLEQKLVLSGAALFATLADDIDGRALDDQESKPASPAALAPSVAAADLAFSADDLTIDEQAEAADVVQHNVHNVGSEEPLLVDDEQAFDNLEEALEDDLEQIYSEVSHARHADRDDARVSDIRVVTEAEIEHKRRADSGVLHGVQSVVTTLWGDIHSGRGPPVEAAGNVQPEVLTHTEDSANPTRLTSSEIAGSRSEYTSVISTSQADFFDSNPVSNASLDDVQTVLDQAILLWTTQGISAGQHDRLQHLTVTFEHLPGNMLGFVDGDAIVLDTTAAGYGWFVDQTPSESSEFDDPRGAAKERLDLLSVLVHEVGHVLGLDHDADSEVMQAEIYPGVRRLPHGNTTIVDLSPVSAAAHSTSTLDASEQTTGDITFVLSGTDTVTVTGVSGTLTNGLHDGSYTGITSITGGGANDRFTIENGAGTTVTFNGGPGDDQVVIEDGATTTLTFNGDDGTDSIVNQAGTSGTVTPATVETFIDRPLLFIHGFGGSFSRDVTPSGLETYYLTRGIHPDSLQPEPLSNSDRDLVQTIENLGYVNGTSPTSITGTFFSALWDYRTPVVDHSSLDGVDNGLLTNVTAGSIQDASFDSSLDYLAYWLDQATNDWTTLTGSAPPTVDVITHSTGGLVSKAYIQSAAYGAAANLPKVNQLVQVGVPNQGTGQTFAMINNDFSVKSAARVGGLVVDTAWDLVHDQAKTITNPDGSTWDAGTIPAEVGLSIVVCRHPEQLTAELRLSGFRCGRFRGVHDIACRIRR